MNGGLLFSSLCLVMFGTNNLLDCRSSGTEECRQRTFLSITQPPALVRPESFLALVYKS